MTIDKSPKHHHPLKRTTDTMVVTKKDAPASQKDKKPAAKRETKAAAKDKKAAETKKAKEAATAEKARSKCKHTHPICIPSICLGFTTLTCSPITLINFHASTANHPRAILSTSEQVAPCKREPLR